MRTLNRPMFRMGGPIKEGVMHGIREPYRSGQLVRPGPGRPGYAGPKDKIVTAGLGQILPKLGLKPGFMKPWWNKIKQTFGTTAQHQPITQVTKQPVTKWSKGYHGTVPGGTTFQASGPVQNVWTPKGWVARDPVYQIGKKIHEGRGWIGKPIKWAGGKLATPSGAIGLTYVGGQWLKSDGTPATDQEVESQFNFKGGTKPGEGRKEGMYYEDPEKAKKLAAKRRDDRITNLLETMGYDAAKKDAVSKALIDASQIVSDRGTLDKKNITRELINPIIQATSKRLEKPEQLNEAVRLMLTKAEIEKEMNPLDSEVKRMQIAVAKKKLAGPNLQEAILAASKDGPPMGETLSGILRRTGVDSVVLPIKVGKNKDTLAVAREVIQNTWKNAATEPDKVVKPGIYVVRERIIEVKEDGSVNPVDV